MRRILIKLLHPLAFRGVSCNLHREERSVYFANYLWLLHILKKTAIFIIESSQEVACECVCVGCRRKVGNTQCSNSWEQTTAKRFRILGPKFRWHLAELIPCKGRPFCWQPVLAPLPWLAFYRVLHVWQTPQNAIMQMSGSYFENSIRNALMRSHCSSHIHFN